MWLLLLGEHIQSLCWYRKFGPTLCNSSSEAVLKRRLCKRTFIMHFIPFQLLGKYRKDVRARLPNRSHHQKKSASLIGVRQHLTGNHIPCCSAHALMPVNLVFTVSPLHWNPTPPVLYAARPLKSNHAKPKKRLPPHNRRRCGREAADGRPVSNNCARCYRQTALL